MTHSIINGNKNVIIIFGGISPSFGGTLPFEFLNYLSSNFKNTHDLYFFIDEHQCWYHKGIKGITNNINETVIYLKNLIANYDEVIFMGTSAGGYASILFGSLCNVHKVISFIPQTILENPINTIYKNLKNVINPNVNYILHGDINSQGVHHISHCENIKGKNIKIIRDDKFNMKLIRDNGTIKNYINLNTIP
jgi:hypothetical protein